MSTLETTVLSSMDPETWYIMANVSRRCGLAKIQVSRILSKASKEGLVERKPRVGRPGYLYKSRQKNIPRIPIVDLRPGEALLFFKDGEVY
ncbi:hypothetical protein [Pontibacterium sp.]|uniref:hypothetical protein n=1 Tax=Pontibacterium sp. TaxID=2036026 RepID=UPI003565E8E5